MLFPKLDVNDDQIIGKPYYLSKVKIGDLIDYVKTRFSEQDFTKFNNEYDSIANRTKKRTFASDEELKKNYDDRTNYCFDRTTEETTFEEYKKDRYDSHLESIENDKKEILIFEKAHNFIYNAAIENNFISLYAENVKELVKQDSMECSLELEGEFYLLDGFRRLLFDFEGVEKNKDAEIYVKIYDSMTTHQDMMNLMFHFNLWKFPQGITTWLDRGWRFFLYKKLGVYLDTDDYRASINIKHFTLISNYLLGGRRYGSIPYKNYQKLLTGPRFYDDILEMDKAIHGENFIDAEETHMHSGKIESYLRSLFQKIGRARMTGNDRPFILEDYKHFIKLEKNEVLRIRPMSVRGHYEKPIDTLNDKFIAIWIDDKELEKMRNQNPDDVKLKKLPIDLYYNTIPDKSKKAYGMICRKESIVIKKNSYNYANAKLYHTHSNYADAPKMRIYFFADKYFVYKDSGFTTRFVIKDMDIEYRGYNSIDDIFRGTQEEVLQKIEELTGTKIDKLNRRETEFY